MQGSTFELSIVEKNVKEIQKGADNDSRSSLKSESIKGGIDRLVDKNPLKQARMPKNKGVYYGINTCCN